MNTTLRMPPQNHLDPWKTWSVTVKRFRSHASGVFTADIAFDDAVIGRQFRYFPGQFNMLYVPGVGESAISIAGTTIHGVLQHTIRTVGAVTQAIASAGVGMSLGLRGPFGSGWPLERASYVPSTIETQLSEKHHENGDVIIVAGGIGLAPLRALVNHITSHRERYGKASVLIGARTPDDLLYQEEHDDWRSKNVEVYCTVDRAHPQWRGQIGVVTLLLDRLAIPNPSSTVVMTCGPEVMMRYVAKSAMGRGIQESNIFVSLERNMNCAIGLCGHCQLGPKFICKDGPVFRYDAVSSLLRVQEL